MSGTPVQAEMFENGLGGYLRPVTEKPTLGAAPKPENVTTGKLEAITEPRNTHRNSRAAYRGTQTMRHDRRAIILGLFQDNPAQAFTDREVLARIYPGSGDLNMVRPRITELVESGELREVSSVRCLVTGKTVRACAANKSSTESESHIEHELIKGDPSCPRCGACKFSEFTPCHLGPTEKQEGEEWKDNQ